MSLALLFDKVGLINILALVEMAYGISLKLYINGIIYRKGLLSPAAHNYRNMSG